MTQQTPKQLPRFIHLDDQYAINRYTVAYVRTPEAVFFAWSKLSKTDNYNKKIGREISSNRLLEYLEKDTSQTTEYCGVLTKAEIFKPLLTLKNMLSDQCLSSLTLMDLKHRKIGNAIIDYMDYIDGNVVW